MTILFLTILLSLCRGKMYKLIRDLAATMLPKQKSFAELTELVKRHQCPEPSVIVQRFHLNSRFRKQEESVADYVAALRHLTEHCKFRDDLLTEMLRDRLVCGINHEPLQHRLLSEADLTFKKALDIAVSMETAASDAQHLQKATPTPTETVVHAVQHYNANVTGKLCYQCQRGNIALISAHSKKLNVTSVVKLATSRRRMYVKATKATFTSGRQGQGRRG